MRGLAAVLAVLAQVCGLLFAASCVAGGGVILPGVFWLLGAVVFGGLAMVLGGVNDGGKL